MAEQENSIWYSGGATMEKEHCLCDKLPAMSWRVPLADEVCPCRHTENIKAFNFILKSEKKIKKYV
jgi:hypothetical protein